MTTLSRPLPEDASKVEEVRHAMRETREATVQMLRRMSIGLPASLLQFFALPDLITAPADLRGLAVWLFAIVAWAIVAWALWPLSRSYRVMRRRTPAIVLWLRRFHDGRHAPGLLRFLEGAVGLWGQMFTLADDVVSTPFFSIYVFAAIAVLVGFASAIRMMLYDSAAAGAAIAAGMSALMIAGIVYQARRRSVSVVESPEQIRKLAQQFRQVRTDRLSLTGFSKILKCTSRNDDVWHLVIRTTVPEVDAVLIDVSEFSSNIEWEIQTVIMSCPPHKIVLMIRQDLLNGDGSVPVDLSRRLATTFAGYRVPTLVAYPTRIPWIMGSPTLRAVQETIGLAILRDRGAPALQVH